MLFVSILVAHPARLGCGHTLMHWCSLKSNLLALRVDLGLCAFCHSELQEDVLHPMEPVQILFHIGYGVRCVASVLCHHTEVNEGSDASESTFERYCLRTSWLAKSHGENSQNTTPQISHLFPLPLRNC